MKKIIRLNENQFKKLIENIIDEKNIVKEGLLGAGVFFVISGVAIYVLAKLLVSSIKNIYVDYITTEYINKLIRTIQNSKEVRIEKLSWGNVYIFNVDVNGEPSQLSLNFDENTLTTDRIGIDVPMPKDMASSLKTYMEKYMEQTSKKIGK